MQAPHPPLVPDSAFIGIFRIGAVFFMAIVLHTITPVSRRIRVVCSTLGALSSRVPHLVPLLSPATGCMDAAGSLTRDGQTVPFNIDVASNFRNRKKNYTRN